MAQSPTIAPLQPSELIGIAHELQSMLGSQLQDALQTETELGLQFYHERETIWLWIDLHPQRPLIVRLPGRPPSRKKITRPLLLFIKSRFKNRRLKGVRVDIARGRVLILSFARGADEDMTDAIEFELRLFPRGQNIIAHDGSRSVAESKPKPLTEINPGAPSTGGEHDGQPPRAWGEIEAQWLALQAPAPVKTNAPALGQAALDQQRQEREWIRAIEKKTKALERMAEELKTKLNPELAELGHWLKTNLTLEVPEKWASMVDQSKTLSWNIERSFHQAKENLRKASGTEARIHLVEKELRELQARGPKALAKKTDQAEKKSEADLLARAKAKGRRLKIGDDLEVYIGKSAADNLALLRRAQPFDYWLHLRDMPGSHAIMRRTRNRNVTDAEFDQAGRWVIEQSLNRRASELKGERHDLLIVERRFVSPIKGDRLGRVNYSNDRVMRITFA